MLKFLFILWISSSPVADSEIVITGEVIAVFDGNSVEVLTKENENFRIVLLGVDCPEMSQEFGPEAQAFLEKCLLRQVVVANIHGKDRLKNYIGVVLLKGQRDVRFELLEEGLAWTAEKSPFPELEKVRIQAEKKRKGLWNHDSPTPPWIYRKRQSMSEPKAR